MSKAGARSVPERSLNPSAVSLAVAARLLSAAGGQRVTIDMLEADVAAGAPTNADGTLNLIQFAAWLVMQASGSRPQAAGTEVGPAHVSCRLKPDARSQRAGGSHD